MPQDYYEDGDSTPSESKSKDEGAATALLPKSFFGDKQLEKGKRCEVEIQKITDDQVLVSKVAESDYKSEDDTHEMPDGSQMKDSEMDIMMD